MTGSRRPKSRREIVMRTSSHTYAGTFAIVHNEESVFSRMPKTVPEIAADERRSMPTRNDRSSAFVLVPGTSEPHRRQYLASPGSGDVAARPIQLFVDLARSCGRSIA